MNPLALRSAVLSLCFVVFSASAAGPFNDMFTNAAPLSGSAVLLRATNSTATAEPGEPRYHNTAAVRSVWWSWQAPADGRAVLNATNGNTRFRVVVFTGDVLTNLTLVSSNTLVNPPRPAVFDVTEGQEYKFVVDYTAGVVPPFFFLTLNHYQAEFVAPTNNALLQQVSTVLSLTNMPAATTNVTYFSGTNLLASVTEEPFAFNWVPEHTGTNMLNATILSADGSTNWAWPVTVKVVPVNDHFTNALVIVSNVVETEVRAELRFASAETNEPFHGFTARHSVWWRWTPQWDGIAYVYKEGGEVLNVYTGTELTNLVLVKNVPAGADPSGTFLASAGTEYFFQLDGLPVPPYAEASVRLALNTLRFAQGELELAMPVGGTQRISLTNSQPEYPLTNAMLYLGTNVFAEMNGPDWGIDFSTNVLGAYDLVAVGTNSLGERRETPLLRINVSPVNDLFTNAELLVSAPGNTVVTGSLAFATHEPWETVGGRLGSIWYRWVAPFSAYLQVSVEEGAPEIRFFTGDSVANLSLVTNTFEIPLQVLEGSSYYIAVDAYSGYDGPFAFTLHAPPVNDDFADAITITNNVGQIAGSNRSAWSEPGETVPDETYRRSIWFKWTAPETGDLNLNTHETLEFTAQFAAYEGNSISNLQTVVAPFVSSSSWGGWRGIRVRARTGVTYHFRLSGYSDRSRIPDIILNYNFQPLPNIPANDDFSGALLLTGLTNAFLADNTLASLEAGEPPASGCDRDGRTLWYKYVPVENGLLYLFAGNSVMISASFAIYEGTERTNLTQLAGACSQPIMVNVSAGVVYYIQIDSSFGRGPQINVDQRLYPAPPNDNFENAVQIEGTNFTYHGNNYSATLQDGEVKANPTAAGKTVWISWLAPSEGRAMLRGFSSHMFGVVQVFQGPTLTNLVPVQSVWDNWQTFHARAGEVYHLQMDGQDGSYGDFSLVLTHEPFPDVTNDHFSQSRRLAGNFFTDTGSMQGATVEPDEPPHIAGEIKSIWWHWQAPITGRTAMFTEGSLVPVTIAVYKGDKLELLELVAKGTNVFLINVTAGVTYRIAAVTAADARGLVVLRNGSISPTDPFPVPGNILPEGSFEGTALQFQHWQIGLPIGGYVNEPGGADGQTWPVLQGGGGSIWQDFATVAGEQYALRFAVKGENEPPYVNMRVTWEDQVLGVLHVPGQEWSFWHWTNYVVTARSNVTRIKFENLNGLACLDAVSVVWLNEPPSIHTQPTSISAYDGGAASFVVAVRGVQPIELQWFFNGEALPGETNRTLFIDPVGTNHIGRYHLEATNRFGFARSSDATLGVKFANSPEIVLQPYGGEVLAGSYHVLEAAAIGTPPLRYQWYFNGTLLEHATNSQLVLTNFQQANVGPYFVRIANFSESIESLTANLRVASNVIGGAEIYFMNFSPHPWEPRVNARVYDLDGVTGLNNNYVAQLYAGRSLEELRPAGQPVRFLNGFHTGVVTPTLVTLKNVAPGEKAFIQMRAWDPLKGATFEVARALGGKFGRSEVLELELHDGSNELFGLKGFNLQAGLPEFNTGRLSIASSDEEEILWKLEGAAGFKYLIERCGADFNWRPFQIIFNQTGSASFSTTTTQSTEFYRSRILD